MKKLTDEIFKERLFKKYGDRIRATEPFRGMHIFIGFVCSKTHVFQSTPSSILNKNNKTGCRDCGTVLAHESQRSTAEEVMVQVRAKHGDVFRLVGEYRGRKAKTEWECINGHKFPSSLDNIMQLPGCKRCAGKVNNHEEYVDELKVRFSGRVWPLERYKNSHFKILHGCINGHTFTQCPNQVLDSALGCCSECSKNKRRSNEEYDALILKIHGDRVFRIGEYDGSNRRIMHGCGICGNEWPTSPGSVVHQESGCAECAEYGFKMSLPAFLYYLRVIEKVSGNHYFKIGITNRDVELRIGQMIREGASIEKISTTAFVTGREAHALEQRILKECAAHRATGVLILKNGNSEMFNRDISQYLSCYFTVTP